MKLYLSSYRIPTPDDLSELIGKEPDKTRLALIPNAGDYYAELPRSIKIRDKVDYLYSLGYKPVVVDLRDFDSPDSIYSTLKDFDAVLVSGGNTFCLRHEMKKSGFDLVIKRLVDEGMVYIGESAGAVVAGKTLKGTEFADNPEFTEIVIWDGLSLTPNVILPHADSVQYGAGIAEAMEMHKHDKNVIILNDNQAFIVNGSIETTVSSLAN